MAIFVKRHAEAVAKFAQVTVLHVSSSSVVADDLEIEKTDELTTIRAHWPKTTHPLFKLKRMFSAAKKAKEWMDAELPAVDLVHCHMLARTAWIAQQLFSASPYMVTEHWTGYVNGKFEKLNPIRKISYRRLAKRAAAFTVVSHQLKNALIGHGFRKDIEIIPNVVEVPNLERGKNEITQIVTVADFHERNKNISGILHAIAKLKEEFNFHWTIVGDGDDREEIQKLAEDLNLTDRVDFPGRIPQEEVHKTLADCDLLVVNSRFETFSMVTVEALMLGLPIIATRCGGPENFVNSSNGFLIDTDDQEGLENALRTFLKDPGQFDPESLKKSVDYTFSKEAVGQAFLNLYNSILNR